jgi:YVTN family beta-propeller protein
MSKLTNPIMALLLIVLAVSCKKEEDNRTGSYAEPGSAIVVNEGSFGTPNGSLSFIDVNGKAVNNIFELENNGASIGDVALSYTPVGNKGIICVNNSDKIEIVDIRTFKRLATIADAAKTDYVRYTVGIDSSKVYVSNGSYDGTILVINLENYTIEKTIPVGKGPEQMALVENKVYVCNSGGFDENFNPGESSISVINTNTETVETTITVGDIPAKIVKDAQGYLWVLCKGKPDYDNGIYASPARLVRINPNNNTVDKSFIMLDTGSPLDYTYPLNMTRGNNGQTVYYYANDNIYAVGINDNILPTKPIISKSAIYGLSASPYNNQIWAMMQSSNFSSAGFVFRYTPGGALIDSIKVGIAPNGAVFRE